MADVDATEAENTAAAAAEIVGSVDDLLLEIFRRVPSEKDDRNPRFELASRHLRSLASQYSRLIRLKSVSRQWNSIISLLPKPFPFPAASSLIFECGPSSFILFVDKSITSRKPFRKINGRPWHSGSKIVHSCNGLLLCASNWCYSVCNPTTGKHSALPPAKKKFIRGASLVFDPSKSPHYKVVCVLGSDNDIRNFQFVVYSSEKGCWGKPGKLFKSNYVRFGNGGVYWNGAIHWVGSSELVSFNPDDDDDDDGDGLPPGPKVMPMPIARDHQRYYFGESRGHLHYIGLDDGPREVVVHEMMMSSSDYSAAGTWVVKYIFDVSNVVRHRDDFNVYSVVRGEKSEDTFLVLGTIRWRGGWKKIVRFNHDNTFETIYDFDGSQNPLKNPDKHNHPFQHIDSLASVY